MLTVPLARHGVPEELFQRLVALRRELHRHPELAWREARTAARIAREVEALGLPVRTGVGGHGLIAEIPGAGPGPAVALRADMDALPLQEETGLPFASEVDGVMHACEHDGHSALLVGAAALLAAGPPPAVPIRLLWQPAEETGAGAREMIADGALDGVGAIFGGHLDRHYPVGHLVVTDGVVNASTDTFFIDVHGRGGHGGRPHEAVDAVVAGSLLVTALQSIVSREVDPAHPSVLSVGRFVAGDAPNVIAAKARLEGTIRAQDATVRAQLRRAVQRVADAVAAVHGAQAEVTFREGTPALHNDPEMTALAREAAVEVVGAERVGVLHTANMGGEDFASFLREVPGCYVRYGAQVAGREGFPAHSSRFDFHEEALASGAAWLVAVARRAAHRLARGEPRVATREA